MKASATKWGTQTVRTEGRTEDLAMRSDAPDIEIATRADGAGIVGCPSPNQYPIPYAIALHLLPGMAMTAFIVVAVSLGMPAVLALFLGIPLVLVPIELGYLLYQAKRRSGRWSLTSVVEYREQLSTSEYAAKGIPLYLWFILMLVVSVSLTDEWMAAKMFSWLPEPILTFASFETDGETWSSLALVTLVGVALIFNGLVGPVVEELYFRGHLLPSMDRLGSSAPILNAVLFSVYHLWTPWQNPGRIIGLIPWVIVVWRTRSVHLSIGIHVAVNLTFLALMIPALLGGA